MFILLANWFYCCSYTELILLLLWLYCGWQTKEGQILFGLKHTGNAHKCQWLSYKALCKYSSPTEQTQDDRPFSLIGFNLIIQSIVINYLLSSYQEEELAVSTRVESHWFFQYGSSLWSNKVFSRQILRYIKPCKKSHLALVIPFWFVTYNLWDLLTPLAFIHHLKLHLTPPKLNLPMGGGAVIQLCFSPYKQSPSGKDLPPLRPRVLSLPGLELTILQMFFMSVKKLHKLLEV